MIPWNKGLKMSDEQKQKLSQANKGKKKTYQTSDETRKLISEARKKQTPPMLGKKHSEETLQKMSDTQKRTRHSPHTDESKAKMSVALVNAWKKKRGFDFVSQTDERLRREYGISEADYNGMFELQNGACAICHTAQKDKKLAVDHDHKTGRVRGLLCQKCNTALGLFSDNRGLLERAIDYVVGR